MARGAVRWRQVGLLLLPANRTFSSQKAASTSAAALFPLSEALGPFLPPKSPGPNPWTVTSWRSFPQIWELRPKLSKYAGIIRYFPAQTAYRRKCSGARPKRLDHSKRTKVWGEGFDGKRALMEPFFFLFLKPVSRLSVQPRPLCRTETPPSLRVRGLKDAGLTASSASGRKMRRPASCREDTRRPLRRARC